MKTKASRATGRSELRYQTVIALAPRFPDETLMSHFQPLLLYDRSVFDISLTTYSISLLALACCKVRSRSQTLLVLLRANPEPTFLPALPSCSVPLTPLAPFVFLFALFAQAFPALPNNLIILSQDPAKASVAASMISGRGSSRWTPCANRAR